MLLRNTKLYRSNKKKLKMSSRPERYPFTFVSTGHTFCFQNNINTITAIRRKSKLFPPRHKTLRPSRYQAASLTMMPTTGEDHVSLPVKSLKQYKKTIRPRDVKSFSVPYDDYVIRAWEVRDLLPCIELIRSGLAEYGLEFDPHSADRDVVDVENAYREGEFWVVEDIATSCVVGTAAFCALPHQGIGTIELCRMYLSKDARGRGLGSFLLSAIEQRAFQLGYTNAFIKTASVMKQAYDLYISRGYTSSGEVKPERCNITLEKPLIPLQPPLDVDHVEVIDMTRGWTITCTTRKKTLDHRILYRAVVVLVESGDKVLVHKRSIKKSTHPGKMAALVTGCVDWMEEPLVSAMREIKEEVGISGLKFSQPFPPFIARSKEGQRIQFHPYVAKGNFSEEDIVCNPNEVEEGVLMRRQEIVTRGIGGTLFHEFRERGL